MNTSLVDVIYDTRNKNYQTMVQTVENNREKLNEDIVYQILVKNRRDPRLAKILLNYFPRTKITDNNHLLWHLSLCHELSKVYQSRSGSYYLVDNERYTENGARFFVSTNKNWHTINPKWKILKMGNHYVYYNIIYVKPDPQILHRAVYNRFFSETLTRYNTIYIVLAEYALINYLSYV